MKQTMITSIHNDKVKAWGDLSQKKHRDATNTFLIEGDHGVEEAINSGHCIAVWVNETIDIDFLDAFAGTVYVSPQIVLNKIAHVASQVSIIGLCKKPTKKITSFNRLLVCDKIQDPGNLGTIIRSALAFGFDGVYVSRDSVDVFNDKVVRSTQGALFQLPIEVVDLKETLILLKEKEVLTVGLALHENTIDNLNQTKHMAFVVGNESVGISKDILKACDELRMIPIQNIDSLNVGVAASIIAYVYSNLN